MAEPHKAMEGLKLLMSLFDFPINSDTEMSWLQDSKSAILQNQPTCCTYELNPRWKKP